MTFLNGHFNNKEGLKYTFDLTLVRDLLVKPGRDVFRERLQLLVIKMNNSHWLVYNNSRSIRRRSTDYYYNKPVLEFFNEMIYLRIINKSTNISLKHTRE